MVQIEILPEIQQKIEQNFKTFNDSNGIIRIQTRLGFGDDPLNFKFPILLPNDHHITELLIRFYHEKYCHGGLSFLLSKIRENFWIINSRKAIKRFLRSCVTWKKLDTKSASFPTPPLPKDRIAEVKVFEVVGVDLAGPLLTKNKKKIWIVLFTCAVYRAVHLELVSSLSTDIFILALRRFIARRGRPQIIYSDNGTNFRGLNNCFKRLNWDKIQEVTIMDKIVWKFNPPTGAWWGGWWERIVRTVKSLLIRVLGKATLNFEEINTILCDIESVINDRPLTYVSENNDELIPITPALFLRDLVSANVVDLDQVEKCDLEKTYRYREKIKMELKQRFRKEYLGQLVQRGKEKGNKVLLREGDIVLIGDDNKKRRDWTMGKINKLIPGKDEYTRVATVKTNNGELIRPVQRLFPLEVLPHQMDINKDEVRTKYGRVSRPPNWFGMVKEKIV